MTIIQITDREKARLAGLALIMFAGLGLLALALWFIQLGQGHFYRASQEQQSVRRVRLPAVRGKIFDRNGICLADNQPDYSIGLYLEELRRFNKKRPTAWKAWDLIQQLAQVLAIEPQTTLKQVNDHLYNRKPLPLAAWRHIDARTMARFAENSRLFPAAEIMLDSRRVYPEAAAAAHLIGYVGAIQTPAENDQQYHYYLPDVEGQRGIEKIYNKWLAGTAGGRLVRIDAAGYKHDEESIRAPTPGGDLRLSLDLRLQKIAERAIADTCGAVVVLDPMNGDVVALASAPGFDLNLFYPALSVAAWRSISADERKPLFNRAVAGRYAPGSTFKPMLAMAALVQGKAGADTTFVCDGFYELGGQIFTCHTVEPHGRIDLGKALEVSCNVFFFKLGLQCGYDALYHMALAAGFGEKTGLDLDSEAAGFLPSKAWKRQAKGEPWTDGDTCNIAVGQGALLVTPLQMALFTAALANGGRLFRPRLVIGQRRYGQSEFEPVPPVLQCDLRWPAEHLAMIKDGLRRVVNESSGTGHLARLPEVVMAGKTGTAEFGRKGSGRQRGWMILFAPYENPRYAVAMVVDEGVSGGLSVAPRLKKMMAEFFAI